MSRVLLYRALGLGDFLTGVPSYRALGRAFPAYDVVLAAPEPLRPLAALTGAVDTFLPTPELQPPAWVGPPPDVAVNLHGAGPQSHRLLQSLQPGRLIAFGRAERDVAGPTWCDDEHEVRRWCRLLQESGVSADPADLVLDIPAAPPVRRGATVLHPGAAGLNRRWPAERFAAVASALTDAGHRVVVTGVAAEQAVAAAVARGAGLPADRVLAGRLDLAELAALVAAARLVICGDTGVAHLATAFRTRSVLLFGPMSPALWGPPADPRHTVLWRSDLAGTASPPDETHPALLALTVDDVLAATHDHDPRGDP